MKLEEEKEIVQLNKTKLLTKNAKMVTTRTEKKQTLTEWEESLRAHFEKKSLMQKEYEHKMKKQEGINEFTTMESLNLKNGYMHITPTMLLPFY